MAQDFRDLVFHLESRLALPALTHFLGPISRSMTDAVPPTARAELAPFVTRLQIEAGLTLIVLPYNSAAILMLASEGRALSHRMKPSAACMVVLNVSALGEYRAKRGSADLDWAYRRSRTRVTLFPP